MIKPIRLLLVEDSEDDALLLVRELTRQGYAPETRRVDTSDGLQAALSEGAWDVVISDYNMPGFHPDKAIAMVKEAAPDMPVIIVSGSIGEDIAVAAMRNGAQDYIMKGSLARLAPAIERELREAKTRKEHRRAQKTIEHMAYHDALTGLSNRYEFEQQVRRALESTRHGGCHALLYIDLDQFKIINDTCGHIAGDELLRQVALVLKGPVRGADTLARLGGDEFGVLLENCSPEQAMMVGERMLELVREFRFSWQGKSFSIGASIGMAILEQGGQTLGDVLRQADMACYAAKDLGRNRIHVYSLEDAELRRRHGEMEWVYRLRHALDKGQFELHHQRIVSLSRPANGHDCCEFLVRMHTESGGLIAPGAFIPAAERYNLMPALDRWVVARSFEHVSASTRNGVIGKDGIAFINLSGTTLADEDILSYVGDQLHRQHLPAERICFEITETAAISNLSTALSFINGVKSLGCHVALDDFGAGLSSFSYLKTLPADYLKIDGGFIQDMLHDPMDKAIVEAIQTIGHTAGLKTIAEFVETDETRACLADIGVDFAQGYGIHRPEPVPAS